MGAEQGIFTGQPSEMQPHSKETLPLMRNFRKLFLMISGEWNGTDYGS
jgi:hypothetical protein